MPLPAPWLERDLDFNSPPEMYPDIIERLRGTPARLEDRTKDLSSEILTRREGETWSIQENIGHLLDLESLLARRLSDFMNGRDTLHAWAGHNKATWDAEHNSKLLATLLAEFRATREDLITNLETVEPARFGRSSYHPRLKKPIRLIDLLEFHAQHDDYHIARISQLRRMFSA